VLASALLRDVGSSSRSLLSILGEIRLTLAKVLLGSFPRMDGPHSYGGVWELRKEPMNKALQYTKNSVRENLPLPGGDREHFVICLAGLDLTE